jgi:transposase, IS30 family
MQRITFYERQIVESGLRCGKSHRGIAKSLGRDRRVVDKEIDRNSGDSSPYTAVVAQRIHEQRMRKKNRKKLEKPENGDLRAHVVERLRKQESPEQITGLLKNYPPVELNGKTVSHEAIYQYIYEGDGRYERLCQHLRRRHKKRKRRFSRKKRNSTVESKISIHQRPEVVRERLRYGDWESDTMEGTKKDKVCLSVQFERKSKLVRLHRIENKSAKETDIAIRTTIDSLPQYLFETMTFDNGGESALHTTLRNDHSIDTYHCDAYKSWQKGGVENVIGLVRQYIPKKIPISEFTGKDIHTIQERLNNRPRKSLNYLTPNQVIARETGEGGALEP